jgi:hypothetical protein
VEAPCSKETEPENLLTALPGAMRWKELSSLVPPIRFPNGLFILTSLFVADGRLSSGERERLERSLMFLFPGVSKDFVFLPAV